MNTKDELEIKKYLLNKFQEIPDFEWNQETKTILLQIIQQEKEQKKTNVQKLNFAYKMLNIKNETELYHLPEEEENITYKKKQKEFKQFIETKEISFEILEYENKIKEYEKEIKLQPEIIEINQIKSLKNKILTLKNENENIAQVLHSTYFDLPTSLNLISKKLKEMKQEINLIQEKIDNLINKQEIQ